MSAAVMPAQRRPARSVVLAAFAALLLLLGASGCSTTPAPVVTISKAVWTPCPTTVPPRPAYATETLTGDEDLWRLWTAWSAERRQREAHELDLRSRLIGCVEKPAD